MGLTDRERELTDDHRNHTTPRSDCPECISEDPFLGLTDDDDDQ